MLYLSIIKEKLKVSILLLIYNFFQLVNYVYIDKTQFNI